MLRVTQKALPDQSKLECLTHPLSLPVLFLSTRVGHQGWGVVLNVVAGDCICAKSAGNYANSIRKCADAFGKCADAFGKCAGDFGKCAGAFGQVCR